MIVLRKFFVLAAIFGSCSAFAYTSEGKYSCHDVGGTEGWTITIDLKQRLASLSADDTAVSIPLEQVLLLKRKPPQLYFIFRGIDTASDAGETLRISFNEPRLSATITFDVGGPREKILKTGCSLDNDANLE